MRNAQINLIAKDVCGNAADFENLLGESEVYDLIYKDDSREERFKKWLETQLGGASPKTYLSNLKAVYKKYPYQDYESIFHIADFNDLLAYENAMKGNAGAIVKLFSKV